MKTFQAGNIISQGWYKSFQPNLINRVWKIEDMELLRLLGEADREMGRLDMYSKYIPNIDLFISMHVLKEATQSSKIEGTQTNIEEALLEKEDVPLDKRNDWDEVQNYIQAMENAIDELERLPFSSRLIRNTHQKLMQGVRGELKQPGDFRTSQNWIGGESINTASFVPPVYTSVPELMGDLENFAHNEEYFFPELLKIALIHYQFETIHPFLDGNGRIGRLMITLYLVSKGIIKSPILYLSDFFERNRRQYYDKLMNVREKNELLAWFKFFLVGVIETAKSGINTFDQILQIQKKAEVNTHTLGTKAANAQKIIQYLYVKPRINAEKIASLLNVSPASTYSLINDLEKIGILKEVTGAQRGRVYVFDEYLKIFTH